MTRTNGPWTLTSDNSYMYQLSLVVAIASISFKYIVYFYYCCIYLPVRLLPQRYSSVSAFRLPIDDGIGPVEDRSHNRNGKSKWCKKEWNPRNYCI